MAKKGGQQLGYTRAPTSVGPCGSEHHDGTLTLPYCSVHTRKGILQCHKFHKIANYFSFEELKKKFGPIFKELFTQKIVTKLSKIWIWDPGSGKNLFRIPDPGVKKAPDSGSGSATLEFSVTKKG
jgi:hypothetical protein